jgi:hypothetical protein
VRQPDWKAACAVWEKRAHEYRREIRELQKVIGDLKREYEKTIADLKRERSEWRRLASNKDEEQM